MKVSKNYGKGLIVMLVIVLVLSVVFIGQRVQAAGPLKDDYFNKVAKNGVKKVIIPSFQITFRTLVADTAKSKGNLFGRSPQASAAMVVSWPNVDKAMLQKVADEVYTEFLQKFAASGIEVVPMATVIGTSAYKKLVGTSGPQVKEKYIVISPTGLITYDPGEKLDPNGSFMMGLTNTNMKGEGDILKELNADLTGMAVARVSLVVSIGGYKKSNSIGGSTASASISFDPVVSLYPALQNEKVGGANLTDVTILSNYVTQEGFRHLPTSHLAKDTSHAYIQEVLSSGVVAGTLTDSMTTGENVGMALVSVLGALSGQGASLKKYEFTVDPANYELGTKEIVGKFSELVVDRIKSN